MANQYDTFFGIKQVIVRRGTDYIYIFKAHRKREEMRRICGFLLRQELNSRGISVRSLGNPNSDNYIGLSAKTIERGLKYEQMSEKTLDALSEIIDIDYILMDETYEEEAKRLRKENADLKKKLNKIKKILEIV